MRVGDFVRMTRAEYRALYGIVIGGGRKMLHIKWENKKFSHVRHEELEARGFVHEAPLEGDLSTIVWLRRLAPQAFALSVYGYRVNVWQIWRSRDGSEESTFPANSPHFKLHTTDVYDRPMKLVHQFLVLGHPDDPDTVARAAQYSKKWRFDEGSYPAGCIEL